MEMDTEEVLKEMEKLKPQLRIEYGAKCYRDNSPRDCHYLAHFMYSINKDSEKASTLFKTTCDEQKYAESCHWYANLLRIGKLNRQQSSSNDEEIECFNYYRKGCQFGQARSCFFTVFALFNGIARMSVLEEENPDLLALKMLDRGCDLGCSESCYLAGGAHLVGIPGVMDKNVSITYTSTTSKRVNWVINSLATLSAALCQLEIPPAIQSQTVSKSDSCSWKSCRSEKKNVSKDHVHHKIKIFVLKFFKFVNKMNSTIITQTCSQQWLSLS